MSDITDHLFISAGMDYYVAGRYAVFAGLNPTAANLLHHAVEMALKGVLAKKGMDLKALKKLASVRSAPPTLPRRRGRVGVRQGSAREKSDERSKPVDVHGYRNGDDSARPPRRARITRLRPNTMRISR
jgi:hypothetical protein